MTQTPNTAQDPANPEIPEAPFIIGGPVTEQPAEAQPVAEPVQVVEQPPVEQLPVEQPVEAPQIVEQPPVAPPQPEQIPAVEKPVEQPVAPVEVAPAPVVEAPKPIVEAAPQPIAPEKSEEEKRIDEILSDKLGDAVALLEEKVKARFIAKGNETVKAVAQIIFAPKTTEHDLLKLVESWFAEASGLDQHYLKQEIKIKVDRLMDYRKERVSA